MPHESNPKIVLGQHNREELEHFPCEATVGSVIHSKKEYRKVYLCGKAGRIYGDGDDLVVLCEEHKHLAP